MGQENGRKLKNGPYKMRGQKGKDGSLIQKTENKGLGLSEKEKTQKSRGRFKFQGNTEVPLKKGNKEKVMSG